MTTTISALPSRGGAALLEKLFAPLGYNLELEQHPLDPAFPEWARILITALPYHRRFD